MNDKVTKLLDQERQYQDSLFEPENHGHSPAEFLLLLEKQLADAKRAWLDHGDPRLMGVIRQLTAVGVAALERHIEITPPRFDTEQVAGFELNHPREEGQ